MLHRLATLFVEYLNRGIVCRYLHEYNEAIECFFTAMSRTGTSPLLASAAMPQDSPVSPPRSVKAESVSTRPALPTGHSKESPTATGTLAHVRDLVTTEGAAGISDVALRAQRQLLQTYNDLAVDCLLRGFFHEAIQLLNKAIRVEKNELALYLNRGGMPV